MTHDFHLIMTAHLYCCRRSGNVFLRQNDFHLGNINDFGGFASMCPEPLWAEFDEIAELIFERAS